ASYFLTTSKLSKWMLSSLFILLKCIYASSAVVKKYDANVLKEWDEFFVLKDEVNLLLENAIKNGLIKRTNEAKVTIKNPSELIKGYDLKQLLMVGVIEFGNVSKVIILSLELNS
ncbi:hypothetical protein, partial [Mycoplasmopsis bovis]|uniref:hypothetical protein n=1 Tax=Mycoplasmopsis bovis TaxID=28903 RepID=UPI003D2E5EB8